MIALVGGVLLCGSNEEGDFVSLTEDQIEKFTDRFKEPEHYTLEQVEDSIHIEVYNYDSVEEIDEETEV